MRRLLTPSPSPEGKCPQIGSRSRNACPTLLLLGSLSCTACHSDHTTLLGGPVIAAVDVASIDSDARVPATAGEGSRVGVEYQAGGTWHVFTSCNPANPSPCNYDIIVSVGALDTLGDYVREDLEVSDALWRLDAGALQFLAETAAGDFDGFLFDTEPGAPLRVDVLLDGSTDPRVLFWIAEETLQAGAPSNPIDLVPTVP